MLALVCCVLLNREHFLSRLHFLNQPINPYQTPVAALGEADAQSLTFAGEINAEDYAALVPRGNFESVLYKVLCALLALLSMVFTLVIVAGFIVHGVAESETPVGAIVITILMGIVACLVWRHNKPVQRARRALKRHPDLLSQAYGRLTESGLAFHDGTLQHWFGPQHLLRVTCSDNGVRIPVDLDPSRFIALTSRLFDQYSQTAMQRLLAHWRLSAKSVASPEEIVGLDLWHELAPMPQDGVAFQGTLTLQQPMRTPLNRQAAVIVSISTILLFPMGVFGGDVFGGDVFAYWARCGFIATGILSIPFCLRTWWQYFRGTTVVSWHQRGWISPSELAILRGSHGCRMSTAQFTDPASGHVDHGEIVELIAPSTARYFLARDHVSDDQQWTQIKNNLPGTKLPENET